ncbi:MAG: hypothetical protein EXR75_15955 [Myxococcales bacterium]|nr:hypothetical protein [Myxococcales bacterium]
MSHHDDIDAGLLALFAAERDARKFHDALALGGKADTAALVAKLSVATADANALDDEEEGSLRLVAIARLLGELDGDDVVDALIDVLDARFPEARSEAGEQLQGLAFERFKEVALGVERALGRKELGSPCLVELPYLLADVPEGGVVKLLGRFIALEDADAVAAAIEALVTIGDDAAVKLLLPLQGDTRMSVVGEDEERTEISIGELATEAIELFQQRRG